jgi:hypothetical protein
MGMGGLLAFPTRACRLMTSSNLVACMIGRSAGFSIATPDASPFPVTRNDPPETEPLRVTPAPCSATRRYASPAPSPAPGRPSRCGDGRRGSSAGQGQQRYTAGKSNIAILSAYRLVKPLAN